MNKIFYSKFLKPIVGFVISAVVFVQLLVTSFFIFPGIALAARTINSATLNGGSSISVAAGRSITAAVTVTTDGSDDNWKSTKYQIEDQTAVCVNTDNHNNDGTYTESFSIIAPSSLGTYDVSFWAYSNNVCSTGESSVSILTDGITVINSINTSKDAFLTQIMLLLIMKQVQNWR